MIYSVDGPSFQKRLAVESLRAAAAPLHISRKGSPQAFYESQRSFLLDWQAGAFSSSIDSACI
jgi:hypothetical protein